MRNFPMLAAAAALSGGIMAADMADAQQQVQTQFGPVQVETVAGGLVHPWGMTFLPDGSMLVTEQPGRLRRVSQNGQISQPIEGIPPVFAEGQGGLLDVTLDPDFMNSGMVYVCYAEPGEGVATTAVARGRLSQDASRLDDTTIIFRQVPRVEGDKHFGCRLAFAPDGTLFITLGERFKFHPAQDLRSHLGKVVRIERNGGVPQNNPFVNVANARPEIWSYGHRNVQGAAIHPQTGELWVSEYGPMGGDEINIPVAGGNYGWPEVSWGRHYSGEPIPNPPTRPEFIDAFYVWDPVISPSGITFYTGQSFGPWQGNLLIAGLTSEGIVRLALSGRNVLGEERIGLGARIRDVEVGPDGAVYALTDEQNGKILRLTPLPLQTAAAGQN